MRHRTAQDLLAERRANVLESMRHAPDGSDPDPTASAMLLAHVATIDAELGTRRRSTTSKAL